MVAMLFNLKIKDSQVIHIKKDGESAHSSNSFSVALFEDRVNVIVDDFICSGSTMKRIYDAIGTKCVIDCICVTGSPRLNRLNFTPEFVVCE